MSGEFGAKTYEPYLTALTDASEIIESLAHSEAFEKVLIENLRERRDTLTFDSVRVNQNDMPPEMIESHGLPSVFDISDFESEILETPAIPPAEETVDELQEPVDELEELLASQNPTNWLFTARYKVNGRPYSMTSSLDGTKLFTEGHDSETVVYDMPPSLATRVLSAIAVAVLVSKDIPARQALPHLENDEPEKLRQLMHNIGNLHGKYVSKKVALLSKLDNDRALLITETEEETPDDSSISVEYQMLWQVLGKTVTDERSHQEESISALLQGERIATRFTERGSSTIPPDQLGHSLNDHDTPLSVFGKQSSSLVYEAVNLAILVILKEYLKQHAHLDTCPAEFGTEEGFILDEYGFDAPDAS